MLNFLLVGAALLTSAPVLEGQPGPVPSDLSAYREAQASMGRDPDAHVRLALWCEAHGLPAERMKHLAIAVVSNPRHSLARGLLGLVEYRGRWQRPDAITEKAQNDALLAEYRDRRARTADDADAQWGLALWCDQNGLKDEAAAHFTAVIKRDPKRDAAWKRLGYRKQGGRWATDAQLAEEKAEADRQKEADRRWKPVLEKAREGLASKSAKRRDEAETVLAAITDPRAVPMLCQLFTGNAQRQAVAVQVLGQIDAAGASRALAVLAAFGDSAEVRRTAIETLRRRDPREFADLLIGFIRDPIKYQVKPVGGPGSPGELFIEGQKANVSRRYSPPKGPNVPPQLGDRLVYGEDGLPILQRQFLGSTPWMAGTSFLGYTTERTPEQRQAALNVLNKLGFNADKARQVVEPTPLNIGSFLSLPDAFRHLVLAENSVAPVFPDTYFSFNFQSIDSIPVGQMELEAQKSAAVAQQQLQNDVQSLERYNAPIKQLNERVLPILKEVAGSDLGDSQETWRKWWLDQIGFTIMPQKASDKPTIVEDVPLAYQPQPVPIDRNVLAVSRRRMSCFGAGTPVHTLSGVQPIEALKEGDRVLTQDTATGALGYKPILVVHRNPPSPTYRIALGDESVVSSHFHRFWKAGQGWVMARDLKAGDTVRTLGGLVTIGSIAADEVQPVFNLDVADDADFFVGRQGALVHDNTVPDLRLTPFDAAPSLTAAARP